MLLKCQHDNNRKYEMTTKKPLTEGSRRGMVKTGGGAPAMDGALKGRPQTTRPPPPPPVKKKENS